MERVSIDRASNYFPTSPSCAQSPIQTSQSSVLPCREIRKFCSGCRSSIALARTLQFGLKILNFLNLAANAKGALQLPVRSSVCRSARDPLLVGFACGVPE